MNLEDRLYSSTEVADILGVSLRSVYRYLEEGSLKADIKTATGRHRFSKNNVLEFLYPDSETRSPQYESDIRVEVEDREEKERTPIGHSVSDVASKAAFYRESDFLEPLNPVSQSRPTQAGSQPESTGSVNAAAQANRVNSDASEPIDWLAKFREAQKARLARQGQPVPQNFAGQASDQPFSQPNSVTPQINQQPTDFNNDPRMVQGGYSPSFRGQPSQNFVDFNQVPQPQPQPQPVYTPVSDPKDDFLNQFNQETYSGQQAAQTTPSQPQYTQPYSPVQKPQAPQAPQAPQGVQAPQYQQAQYQQPVQYQNPVAPAEPIRASEPVKPVEEEKPAAVDWLSRFRAAKAELDKTRASQQGNEPQNVSAQQGVVNQTSQPTPQTQDAPKPFSGNQMPWEVRVQQDREAMAKRLAEEQARQEAELLRNSQVPVQPQPVEQPKPEPKVVQPEPVAYQQPVRPVEPVRSPEPVTQAPVEPVRPIQQPQHEVRVEAPKIEQPVYQPATARVSEIKPAQVSQPAKAPEQRLEEKVNASFNYYTSGLAGLKELAHSLNKSANTSLIPYCFSMYAGMSLYKSIRPFSILHAYIKPEHKSFFEKSLQLKPCERDVAQLCLITSDDGVIFESMKEMHGLKVVSLVRLRKDLLDGGEDELAGELDMIQG